MTGSSTSGGTSPCSTGGSARSGPAEDSEESGCPEDSGVSSSDQSPPLSSGSLRGEGGREARLLERRLDAWYLDPSGNTMERSCTYSLSSPGSRGGLRGGRRIGCS